MLKNYLTIAINNLLKNKLYSAINIMGLAIGLAACIVIALYVKDQYSYDKQWEHSDKIYRVNTKATIPGMESMRFAFTPLPAMPQLQKYFQGKFEQSTRTFSHNMVIDTGNAQFEDTVVQVDPAFIKMFKLEALAGSMETTLTNPNNIALSEEASCRYFGTQIPIGKVITMNIMGTKIDYKVTAVYSVPGNSVFDIPLLSLLDDAYLPPVLKNWHDLNTAAYFQLKNNIDIETLKPLIPAFVDRYFDISRIISDPALPASQVIKMDFQKLVDAHLDSAWDSTRTGGNKTAVMSFAAIAFLVLLIGCLNFTILTTARATQRAKEVAMRKVVGAKRRQIIVQFLGESTLIVLLAMILSLGIIEIILPVFESIVGKALSLEYSSPFTILQLLGLLFIFGISGGLYPAFILSGFRPGNTLKANHSKETQRSKSLRTALVIFQFSISIILIIATSIIYVQVHYSINRDPGFNKENMLIINKIALHPELSERAELLKRELMNLSNISDVCFSQIQPSEKIINASTYKHQGIAETSYHIFTSGVCYDYFSTYKIPIIAGRNYDEDRDLAEPELDINFESNIIPSKKLSERNIIINESASRELGFSTVEEAVGKIIINTTSTHNYTIIGVVADNHIFSINARPRAEAYLLEPGRADIVTVRYKGSAGVTLEQVKSVWKKVMGDIEISTVFVDQLLAKEFKQEQTEMKVLTSFSLLAIVIACMGLYGSASFTVERRIKEIGLRKVMGAKVKNIISLLLWQFSKPVLVANIIAWPIAIFAMQSWLEQFTYRFNPLLMIPICLVSGLIALVIAWFTVSGNTTRVAKSRPIKALRYE
ncbi:MAG: ABC transporter permease [Desulfobacteraceae bacterium]|jgi:putative ABC transport system permease protein